MDTLEIIFEAQKPLSQQYINLEFKHGYIQTYNIPVDITSTEGQLRIKDIAWRITEEMSEVFGALYSATASKPDVEEELADVFHFLIELALLSNVTAKHIGKYSEVFRCCTDQLDRAGAHSEFLIYLGQAMNLLKNRAWKINPVPVKVESYKSLIEFSFANFFTVCKAFAVNEKTLYNAYLNKHAVNIHRVNEKA